MKSLNLIALQAKVVTVSSSTDQSPVPASDQLLSLVEIVKLYRQQEKAYFEKIKRKEFAKDELHFMKKTQEKLDRLLSTINI